MGMFDYINDEQIKCFYTVFLNIDNIGDKIIHSNGSLIDIMIRIINSEKVN